ncbi:hypothetical protein EV363DRAFT_1169260, partial [Boletus edulis]
NERSNDTNALRRHTGPGEHIGEQDQSRSIGGDRERETNADGVQTDGKRYEKGAATRNESLAESQASRHGKRNPMKTGVPEASKSPSNHPRRLTTDHANPPHRRGKLKTRPRKVRSTRCSRTYQVTGPRRGQIGKIGRVVHLVYGP